MVQESDDFWEEAILELRVTVVRLLYLPNGSSEMGAWPMWCGLLLLAAILWQIFDVWEDSVCDRPVNVHLFLQPPFLDV